MTAAAKTSFVAAGIVLAASIGLAVGVGGYTFIYARGASYLTDDPAACANCHVMASYYDAWVQSSHRAAATCNDCHNPAGFVPKYATKASNGFWHSFAFTTRHFPDVLQIKPHNGAIAEASCRRCHLEIVHAIEALPQAGRLECIRCHGAVGHPLS